jgi:hypothetical protein
VTIECPRPTMASCPSLLPAMIRQATPRFPRCVSRDGLGFREPPVVGRFLVNVSGLVPAAPLTLVCLQSFLGSGPRNPCDGVVTFVWSHRDLLTFLAFNKKKPHESVQGRLIFQASCHRRPFRPNHPANPGRPRLLMSLLGLDSKRFEHCSELGEWSCRSSRNGWLFP